MIRIGGKGLGVTMAKNQRKWSSSEVGTLEAMSQRYSSAEIARRLGRTHSSVRGKMWLEKISPFVTLDRFSLPCLASYLGIDRGTLLYWIDHHGLKAQKVRTKKRMIYRVKRKDFVAFYRIKKDTNKLPGIRKIDPAIVEWLGS